MKNRMSKAASTVVLNEIKRGIMKDRERFVDASTEIYINMAFIILHDHFDFDSEMLQKFQSIFELQAECLTEQYMSIEDIEKLALELSNKATEKIG